jgi:hypothetical protein
MVTSFIKVPTSRTQALGIDNQESRLASALTREKVAVLSSTPKGIR